MEEYLEIYTDEENEYLDAIINPQRRPRVIRPRIDHFLKWNEEDFLDRFRLQKNTVRRLINMIRYEISSLTDRNNALTAEDMVLLTLRFYATGSFLVVCGELIGIYYSTASRVIAKVSRSIAHLARRRQLIKMPNNPMEVAQVALDFYNIARFPRCIGAVDCTHVRIQSPGGEEAEIYRNRKNFFSVNVQTICDAKLKIRDIVARWHGSAHDSRIFSNSVVGMHFANGDFGNKLLVGDSGYAVKSYMMTPLRNPQTQAEQLYQESQIRTRNPVERLYGVWKRRFPVLSMGIRLKLNRVESVIVATAVLHNLAIDERDPLPPIPEELLNDPDEVVANVIDMNFPQRNVDLLTRRVLINDHFQRLLNINN